jgi:hypothetical protein
VVAYYQAALEHGDGPRSRGLAPGRRRRRVARDAPESRVHALDPYQESSTLCGRNTVGMDPLDRHFDEFSSSKCCGVCLELAGGTHDDGGGRLVGT